MAPSTSSKSGASAQNSTTHPLGRPTASKQGSRKTKSAWRKNVHLDPSLENPSAARPPAPHTLSDGQLFEVDTRGDHAAARAVLGVVPQRQRRGAEKGKGLKSLEVLRNKSDTPALVGRQKGAPGAKGTDKTRVSKEMKNQLRRIAHRPVAGPIGGSVDEGAVGTTGLKSAAQTAEFDMWDGPAASASSGGGGGGEERRAGTKRKAGQDGEDANEWVEDPRRAKPKVPRTLASTKTPSTSSDPIAVARSLPALPTPHPGTSYIPTATDHAELLQLAYETEARKEEEERKGAAFKALLETNRRAARSRAFEEVDPEGAAEGDDGKSKKAKKTKKMSEAERVNATLVQLAGMDSLPADDEDEADDEADGKEDEEEQDKVYEIKRKTKSQRAKALRVKQEAAAAAARKQARLHRALFSSLPSLRKRLLATQRLRAEAAAAHAQRRLALLRERGLEGRRVGAHRVGERAARAEVALSDELAEGLRGVRTEGNLFRDRFESFLVRGLAPPGSTRLPVQRQGRTGRKGVREFEKPSYRHFK